MDSALRDEILSILGNANDMTLATVRPDGYPQATTVSYANDGLTVYFGTAGSSQKAQNIAQNDRVSLTVSLPYENWGQIRGLSMAGRAERLIDEQQIAYAGNLLLRKFPQGIAEYASGALDGVALFRITPEVISVLDYRKGFGHTDLVQMSEVDRGSIVLVDERSESAHPSGFEVSA
jgi:general stress protein 26